MSLRSRPTARQVRLGTELRKLREGAGITAREAARLAGVDQAKMTHIEAGRAGISARRLRELAGHFDRADPEHVEALARMAGERTKGWWQEYGSVLPQVLLDLAELEHHAHTLRTLQVAHVPGLLQSEGYVRAMLTAATPDSSLAELDDMVTFRLKRRRILERASPPAYIALIHEAALRIKVSDQHVAREQLNHLLETASRPSVTLQIIPFEAEGFTGSGFSMLYLEGPVPQLDTVQFDTVHGSAFEDDDGRLANYRSILDRVGRHALPPARSKDLVLRIKKEL